MALPRQVCAILDMNGILFVFFLLRGIRNGKLDADFKYGHALGHCRGRGTADFGADREVPYPRAADADSGQPSHGSGDGAADEPYRQRRAGQKLRRHARQRGLAGRLGRDAGAAGGNVRRCAVAGRCAGAGVRRETRTVCAGGGFTDFRFPDFL